jgi:Protein of unknown function (DUF3168)
MIADRHIYAKLIAATGVTNLVSTRVYPVTIPQNALYPAIVYNSVYTPANASKTGPTQHDNCVLTIRSWAATYDLASSIDMAVRAALDYTDNGGAGSTVGGVTLDLIQWVSSIDGVEEGNSAPGGGPYFFREATYNLREKL